jgi:hypothetical protein
MLEDSQGEVSSRCLAAPQQSHPDQGSRAASVIDVAQVRLSNVGDTLASVVVSCDSPQQVAVATKSVAAKGWSGVVFVDTLTALGAYVSDLAPIRRGTRPPLRGSAHPPLRGSAHPPLRGSAHPPLRGGGGAALVLHVGADRLAVGVIDLSSGEVIAKSSDTSVTSSAVESAVLAHLKRQPGDHEAEAALPRVLDDLVRHGAARLVGADGMSRTIDELDFTHLTATLAAAAMTDAKRTVSSAAASSLTASSLHGPIRAVFLSGHEAVGPLLESAAAQTFDVPVHVVPQPQFAAALGALALARDGSADSELAWTKPDRAQAARALAAEEHGAGAGRGRIRRRRALVGTGAAAAVACAAAFAGVAFASQEEPQAVPVAQPEAAPTQLVAEKAAPLSAASSGAAEPTKNVRTAW